MEARTLRFPLWAKITTVALVVLIFLVLMKAMGGLLNPFLWALVTAYLFNPLVRWLSQRSKLSRFWWVLFIYVVLGVLAWVGIGYLWPRLYTQFNDLQAALPDIARRTSDWLEEHGSFVIGTLVIDLRPAEADVVTWFTNFASEITGSVPE